eukprot:2597376-Amphidinium_carterae.3
MMTLAPSLERLLMLQIEVQNDAISSEKFRGVVAQDEAKADHASLAGERHEAGFPSHGLGVYGA